MEKEMGCSTSKLPDAEFDAVSAQGGEGGGGGGGEKQQAEIHTDRMSAVLLDADAKAGQSEPSVNTNGSASSPTQPQLKPAHQMDYFNAKADTKPRKNSKHGPLKRWESALPQSPDPKEKAVLRQRPSLSLSEDVAPTLTPDAWCSLLEEAVFAESRGDVVRVIRAYNAQLSALSVPRSSSCNVRQAIKDLTRETILLNKVPYSPNDDKALDRALIQLTSSFGISKDQQVALTQAIALGASRTITGGDMYSVVRILLGWPQLIVTPASAETKPITIDTNDQRREVRIVTESLFDLKHLDAADDTDVWLRIRIILTEVLDANCICTSRTMNLIPPAVDKQKNVARDLLLEQRDVDKVEQLVTRLDTEICSECNWLAKNAKANDAHSIDLPPVSPAATELVDFMLTGRIPTSRWLQEHQQQQEKEKEKGEEEQRKAGVPAAPVSPPREGASPSVTDAKEVPSVGQVFLHLDYLERLGIPMHQFFAALIRRFISGPGAQNQQVRGDDASSSQPPSTPPSSASSNSSTSSNGGGGSVEEERIGVFTREQTLILNSLELLLRHRYYSVRVRDDPLSLELLKTRFAGGGDANDEFSGGLGPLVGTNRNKNGVLAGMQPVFPHRAGTLLSLLKSGKPKLSKVQKLYDPPPPSILPASFNAQEQQQQAGTEWGMPASMGYGQQDVQSSVHSSLGPMSQLRLVEWAGCELEIARQFAIKQQELFIGLHPFEMLWEPGNSTAVDHYTTEFERTACFLMDQVLLVDCTINRLYY
jgi:hypothetical protein